MTSTRTILATLIPVLLGVCLVVELYFAQASDGWIFTADDSTGWTLPLRIFEGAFGAYLVVLFAVCGGLIAALLPHSWLGYLMIVLPSVIFFTFRTVLTVPAPQCAVTAVSALEVSRCAIGYGGRAFATIVTNQAFLALAMTIVLLYWGPRILVDRMIVPSFRRARERLFSDRKPEHRLRFARLEQLVSHIVDWCGRAVKTGAAALLRVRWYCAVLVLVCLYAIFAVWLHRDTPSEMYSHGLMFSIAVLSVTTYIVATAASRSSIPPPTNSGDWRFYLLLAGLPLVAAIAYQDTLSLTARIELDYRTITPLSYPYWALITVTAGYILRALLEAGIPKRVVS